MTDANATDFGADDLGDDIGTDEPSEGPDGLDEPTEADYADTAEQLAEDAAQAQQQGEDGGDPAGPREQRYRQRAQAAEADRDRLAAVVEQFQRAEVQRLTAGDLADASDLWRDGAQLADVLDDQGRVDPAKLDGLVKGLLRDHPHWKAPIAPRPIGRLHSGATSTRLIDSPAEKFEKAFGPKAG
jgi:acyl-CoA reductase-like NAD-dependent aldehyde dehydrogenase